MKAIAFAFMFLAAMFLAVVEVQTAQANPIINVYRDIPPPEGAQPPIITVHMPENGSSYAKNVMLTFTVAVPKTNATESLDAVTKIYYKGSWEPNEITVAEGQLGAFSVDLSDVRGGNLSVTVYAVGVGYIETGTEYREENQVIWSYNYYDRFEMTGHSTAIFVKDLLPPRITVLSPRNRTYGSPEVKLDFTVDEEVSQIHYSLDGKANQTIVGNTTLTGLTNGEHTAILYVADLAGNVGSSKTLFFNVNSPDLFPSIPIAVAAVTLSILLFAGLLVYYKKSKR